jgi:hypothetical protein
VTSAFDSPSSDSPKRALRGGWVGEFIALGAAGSWKIQNATGDQADGSVILNTDVDNHEGINQGSTPDI